MSTVNTGDTSVNSPTDAVFVWLDRMKKRGELPEGSAVGRANALRQLMSILEPDEPRDPASLLANLDAIARRWALKNAAKPGTTRTYSSRVKSTLEDYASYCENPTTFRFAVREVSPKKAAEAKAAPEEKRAADVAPQPPPAPIVSAPLSTEPKPELARLGSSPPRTFPLGTGRPAFTFTLPPDMRMNDVAKIAYHLMSLASDFDPMKTAAHFAVTPRTLANGTGALRWSRHRRAPCATMGDDDRRGLWRHLG